MIFGQYVFGDETKDLTKLKDFSQIFIKTGIKKVRRASNTETGLTLSIRALKKLKKKINLAKLNGLIYISQSPDSTIPPTSSLIHKKLNLPLDCFMMDIIQGCSSFPYAFFLASRYIKMGVIDNCVILSAETYGKYIEKNNRSCNTIFSDAASAIYLDKKTKIKILSETYMSDGTGFDQLCLMKNKKLYMNGPAVFEFTKKIVPLAVKKLLKDSKLNLSEIDSFYFHQASKLVLDTIKDKLSISEKRIVRSPMNYGNTVSSTIPILLSDSIKNNKIKRKKPILLMGFGVGYSLSGGIIKFE